MKANELMIGDWVQVPSEIGRYKHIRSTFDLDEAILYKPIPLTAEILFKNNIKPNRWSHWLYSFEEDVEGVLEINIDGQDVFWTISGGEYTILKLSYVHELQHCLRLCAIEKDIEL